MKKYFYFFTALSILLAGCSSDDSGSSSNSSYFKININGTEHIDNLELYGTGFSEQENCQTTGDLFLQLFGTVETSNMYFEAHLAHFENTAEFDNSTLNVSTSSRLTDRNSVFSGAITGNYNASTGTWDEVDVCNFKYDLSLIYLDETTDKYLKFKVGASNEHNITNVTFVSEDQYYKIYKVEGNFSGTFNNNGTDIPFYGDYKRRLDVLK